MIPQRNAAQRLLNNHRRSCAAFTAPSPFTLSFPHSSGRCVIHNTILFFCKKKTCALLVLVVDWLNSESCYEMIRYSGFNSFISSSAWPFRQTFRLYNLVASSNLASMNQIQTQTYCKSDSTRSISCALCCTLCVCTCVCPPAAEASCSGVSAVLSCPLRTAAPSTLAPASNRSWRETHHICYIRQCLTCCNLFMDRPLTSHLSLKCFKVCHHIYS